MKNRILPWLLACAWAIFSLTHAHALLPIEHWQETSGAKVWLVQSHAIPMVDIQIEFDAGSRRDPPGKAGLAAAVALMSSKGIAASPKYTGDGPMDENALGEAWADLGAGLDIHTERDALLFTMRSLTEPALLERAAHLAARQMAQPSWPQDIWQRERQRWIAALQEADTRVGSIAGKQYTQTVYGTHPYGAQPTEASLASISTSLLQSFHQRHIRACRARITIVGAVTREAAHSLVNTLLASLTHENQEPCPALPPVDDVPALTQAIETQIPFASQQAHILIGQPGFARNDPDYFALLVGNHILGGGSFTSRLMHEVREQRGLSYSVGSYFAPGLHAGAFTISLQTRPDQAQQAIQVTRQVVQRFIEEGPTEEELRAAKDNLTGGFALRIDSNRKLLANVANIARHGLPLDYLEHWSNRIESLTVAEIHAAMRRKLQPERMVTIVVGDTPLN